MGRTRVLVAGLTIVAALAAIVGGVHTFGNRASSSTLTADGHSIPDAAVPADTAEHDSTASTFDLGVFAPSTTDKPAAIASTTTAPNATPVTLLEGFAIVHVNNATSTPVRVWVADGSAHSAVLRAGDAVNWIVKTTVAGPDRGGAVVNGTNCGASFPSADNVVGGREYHVEILPSTGYCGGGQPMPKLVITDYTAGTSRALTGLAPDATHALVYVINNYDAAVKLNLTDDDAIEWTIDPTLWGVPQLLTTATDHGDGVAVTRTDSQCGYGDGEEYFAGGHTYRIEVVDGSSSCSGAAAPGLVIYDLTTKTSRSLGV